MSIEFYNCFFPDGSNVELGWKDTWTDRGFSLHQNAKKKTKKDRDIQGRQYFKYFTMVKRQKEKQYLSAREQRSQGQSRAQTGRNTHQNGTVQRLLPFDCCALTLVPFSTPVCTTSSQVVFDNASLMEFVFKFKRDPVTGAEMELGNSKKDNSNNDKKTSSQIIRLNMDRDSEGRWQCPILTKPFTNMTKIVAVVDRGDGESSLEAYVYSYEAYHELNEKNKNWVDLTTGKKFSPRKDVIILNDPNDDKLQQRRDIQGFWHIQNSRSLEDAKSGAAGGNSNDTTSSGNVRYSVTATRVMEKIEKDRQEKMKKRQLETNDGTATAGSSSKKGRKILAQDVTGVSFTSGRAASSLTSTSMDVAYDNPLREATTEEILQSKFQIMKSRKDEKGYVRLKTNLGDMLVELHCDIVPRTCK
jgi:peptidyl-prolyl cis-trans isomerase-like 2